MAHWYLKPVRACVLVCVNATQCGAIVAVKCAIAGCELLCAACEDKVAQIFYAAVPVIHTLFSGKSGVKIPLDGQDDYARGAMRYDGVPSMHSHSSRVTVLIVYGVCSSRLEESGGGGGGGETTPRHPMKMHLMPELERLLKNLVTKTSNANERTADVSSQVLDGPTAHAHLCVFSLHVG